MYVDDTEITISSSNQAELIGTAHAELLNIAEWMRINELSLNPTNHPRRKKNRELSPQVFINREKISRLTKQNILGL